MFTAASSASIQATVSATATESATSMEIMKVLEQINAMGTTIIMATHDRDIVDRMKKRVVILDHGRLARDIEKGGYYNERA